MQILRGDHFSQILHSRISPAEEDMRVTLGLAKTSVLCPLTPIKSLLSPHARPLSHSLQPNAFHETEHGQAHGLQVLKTRTKSAMSTQVHTHRDTYSQWEGGERKEHTTQHTGAAAENNCLLS